MVRLGGRTSYWRELESCEGFGGEGDARYNVALCHGDVGDIAGHVPHHHGYLLQGDTLEGEVGGEGAAAGVGGDELVLVSSAVVSCLEYLDGGVDAAGLAHEAYVVVVGACGELLRLARGRADEILGKPWVDGNCYGGACLSGDVCDGASVGGEVLGGEPLAVGEACPA